MKNKKKTTLGQKLWMVFQGIVFICVTVWATRETESLFWGILGGVIGELCLMILLLLFTAAKYQDTHYETAEQKIIRENLEAYDRRHAKSLRATQKDLDRELDEYLRRRGSHYDFSTASYRYDYDEVTDDSDLEIEKRANKAVYGVWSGLGFGFANEIFNHHGDDGDCSGGDDGGDGGDCGV